MNKNKKKELIQALMSKDKGKVKKALSLSLPEKWMTIVVNHNKNTIEYQNKMVTESEMKSILEEYSKEYQVKLVVMYQNRTEEGLEETWSFYEPELVLNFVMAT